MSGMKLALVVCWLIATVVALGAPPQNVAGMKFRYSVRGNLFDATTYELLLNPDGTYTGLRSLVTQTRTVVGASSTLSPFLADITIPADGVWAYRVIDQNTAEIIRDRTTLRLVFDRDSATSGMVNPIPNQLVTFFDLEVYNVTTRMVNCSTRCYVASGRSVSFGFVITEGERRVLVRAVGPGLRSFGISQPLENPEIKIYEVGAEFRLPVDIDLPAATRATLDIAAQRAGAFPLPSANDRGKYLALRKGAYVAEITALDKVSAGDVLIEVYQLP